MTSISRRACLVLIVAVLLPAPGWAQPVIEGSVGYVILDYKGLEPVGWFAAIAAKPLPWLSLVSEFSGEYATDTIGTVEVRKRAFVFLDGPRFSHAFSEHAAVFGEVLLGVAHDREFFTDRPGSNHFVWQPGIGADVKLFTHVSARFQVGFRMQGDDKIANRFLSGLVISSTPSAAQRARADAARRAKRDREARERVEREAAAAKVATAEAARVKAERDRARADAEKKKVESAPPPPKE